MKTSILARVPFFGSLPKNEIEYLEATLQSVEAPAGTVLFREGGVGDHFYIVVAGRTEVIKALGTEEEQVIGVRGAGEFLGELSLFNRDGRHMATVRALEQVRMLRMNRGDFDALLHRQPLLAYEMVRVLSERLTDSHTAAIHDLQEKNRRLAEAYESLKAAQREIIEKERMERELQLAYEIQVGILPKTAPRLPAFNFGIHMAPARAVGGDFFDFIVLSDRAMGVVVGDVTGKGVPAAIFMAQTRALWRAEASRFEAPGETLRRVNRHLLEMSDTGLFVTVLYGVLDIHSGNFDYARAGHELPILVDAAGQAELMPQGTGQALGIIEDPRFDEATMIIPRRGTLFLYTDGITDTVDAHERAFGVDRLQASLRAHAGVPAQAMCDGLLKVVTDYQGSAPQFDDITMVAAQRSDA
ncbi:MAG: PP2C family protein-serine/threonine phosphatase [Gammaproteobacteria bacterium]